jgi:Tol biopolymer transport system component/DNA-binding winged helix-turn-helix (wHTH) protein
MNTPKGHAQKRFYEFGAFRLDSAERVLLRNGERIALAPKAFDTLLVLVRHRGHVLTKDDLMQAMWPNSFVEDNNLAQQISLVRRVLDDGGDGGSGCIETVPKRGYRFLGDVRETDDDQETVASDRVPIGMPAREKPEKEGGAGAQGPASTDDLGHLSQRPTSPRRAGTAFGTRHWLGWAATALMVAASVAAWTARSRTTAERAGATGLVRLTFGPGLTMAPALSPDGTLVAYASDRGGTGHLDIWVQPLGASDAVRLTRESTDSYAPTFSPDGRTLAFRSEQAGGGIYIIASHGGEARLVVPFGRRPKFSSDGKWIAYWVGTETGDNTGFFMVPGAKTFIVSATGGAPREIQPAFAAAGYPIWTPDGQHLLFLGNRDANMYNEGTMDWWVTDLNNGAVVRTGAGAAFRAMGFASASQAPEVWVSRRTGVLTSATHGDTRNIWRVPISVTDWTVSGVPERVTYGTTVDVQPSVAGARMAFASVTGTLDVWSLSVDADRTERKGDLARLTDDGFAHGYPAVSPDGREVAFSLQRSDHRDIWIQDLDSGQKRELSLPTGPSFNPNFSPDGTALAYRTSEGGTSRAFVVSLAAGGTHTICDDCSDYGWSSDKRRLVLVGQTPARISILDLATGKKTPLLQHTTYQLWNPRFSPDDRWVSFNATDAGRSKIFVAPVRDTGLVREQDWLPIADGRWDDKPRWSPDGNALYFVSERDEFRCIWAQRLDARKHPSGAAIPIFHAHERRRSLSNVGPGDLAISVARDKIVFNMSEQVGNLWMLNVDAGR